MSSYYSPEVAPMSTVPVPADQALIITIIDSTTTATTVVTMVWKEEVEVVGMAGIMIAVAVVIVMMKIVW